MITMEIRAGKLELEVLLSRKQRARLNLYYVIFLVFAMLYFFFPSK